MDWEAEISIYTLLYTKSTGNKDLLYISRKSIQFSVTAYMGIESGKEWIYVYIYIYIYIWLIHCVYMYC